MSFLDTRVLLERYHQAMINFSADDLADLYAVDAVHEFPFRNPDGIQRLEGRDRIRDYYCELWSDPPVILAEINERATHQPSPTMIINEWYDRSPPRGRRRVRVERGDRDHRAARCDHCRTGLHGRARVGNSTRRPMTVSGAARHPTP